jgi:hypothetical protein
MFGVDDRICTYIMSTLSYLRMYKDSETSLTYNQCLVDLSKFN